MFGFACDETEAHADLEGLWMPLPLTLAQRLTQRLTDVRESGLLPWVRPDGKSQVTVAYDETGTPLSVPTIVIAVQHAQDLLHEFDGTSMLNRRTSSKPSSSRSSDRSFPRPWSRRT